MTNVNRLMSTLSYAQVEHMMENFLLEESLMKVVSHKLKHNDGKMDQNSTDWSASSLLLERL